ncbi:hypothetical protein EVAR_95876_1 [Eumeta japonica]|uniref:Uncharacterized protein n=1 Tax=Eumeta variegata TaxID=151549 RepID=A0A4C1VNF9_EUMVA|nr:hypothetical protein EVAR_95876_1 [Eumeta japonica]
MPGGHRALRRGQGAPQPVPGLPAQEVPRHGDEQGRGDVQAALLVGQMIAGEEKSWSSDREVKPSTSLKPRGGLPPAIDVQ